jgi:hypothetical protein
VSFIGLPNTEPKTATRRKSPECRCWFGVGACLHCDEDACLLSERILCFPMHSPQLWEHLHLQFFPGCTKRLTKRSGGAYVR